MGKLNNLSITKTSKPGLYGDGDNLYLQVTATLKKSWIFRFTLNGKSREMGLGSLAILSLADARAKALECRKLLLDGVDPIEARNSAKQARALSEAKRMTFAACSSAYIEAHRSSWKNAKHASQWVNTIATYAGPIIGQLPVNEVDTALVMKVLEPIWYQKTETADRLRNRIEQIIDWAAVRGYRSGENPARWRGHLDKLLPSKASIQPVKHFTALPVNEVGSFMEDLRELEGVAAKALQFLILTATRTSEVIGAKWSEINFETSLWIIPAERMKAKREHRVPLSSQAISILRSLERSENQELVFESWNGKPLSNNAFLALIKKRMHINVTAHGFRSTFSDWASEKTGHSREVIEMSLAHAIQDATEAAYRRGDLLLKRQSLMIDWAKFCETRPTPSASVLKLNAFASSMAVTSNS